MTGTRRDRYDEVERETMLLSRYLMPQRRPPAPRTASSAAPTPC